MGNSTVRERRRHEIDDSGPSMVAKVYGSTLQPEQSVSYGESGEFFRTSPQKDEFVPGVDAQTSIMSTGIDLNARKLPTVFRWDGPGKTIYIAGSYDNWTAKIPLVKSRQDFYTIVDLPEGTHQYKYYIDGQWICDNSQDKVPNSFGTENNVITVKSSDFEVFEALGIDNAATGHQADDAMLRNKRPGSPPGDYGQVVPQKETSHSPRHSHPPILPAHLLQVILNKEIPQHVEPSLLPEPNHVMLNHLYALSIKDGVMVLSTTHRYRKKYITTIMYKPI